MVIVTRRVLPIWINAPFVQGGMPFVEKAPGRGVFS
jgi:hypothetical protein